MSTCSIASSRATVRSSLPESLSTWAKASSRSKRTYGVLESLIPKSSSTEGYSSPQHQQVPYEVQQDGQSSSGSLNPCFHVLTAEVFFGPVLKASTGCATSSLPVSLSTWAKASSRSKRTYGVLESLIPKSSSTEGY